MWVRLTGLFASALWMACAPVGEAQITPGASATVSCAPKPDAPVTFEADAQIQQIAEAYSLDAVDFAEETFLVTLDWTDESIASVEEILAEMYDLKGQEDPSEEMVWTFSKMIGSYVGEVYRRNHGATWGIVTLGDQKLPGLQTTECGLYWPWAKVSNRLTDGPEDNVWHYYSVLLLKRN